MRTIKVNHDIPWAPIPNELHLILADTLPPDEAIATAFALAFHHDALLLTHLIDRGWGVPGGHQELGETPEATMRRELYEETGARVGTAQLVGYQMIHVFAPMPPKYRYPYPHSYQVFYAARVSALDPFPGNAEAKEGGFFLPSAAREITWVQQNHGLYEEASAVARLMER